MTRHPDHGGARPVVLLAGLPGDPEEQPVPFWQLLEIEEALLSFARAALAAERLVALPGDPFAAPLVAAVGTEYAPPARAEETVARSPLVEVLLSHRDVELEGSLRTLPGVGFRARFDEEAERGEQDLGRGRVRHRLTPGLGEELDPWSIVLIGGFPGMWGEAAPFADRGVPIYGIGPTLAGPGAEAREFDVVDELLAGIEWGDRAEEDERRRDEGEPRREEDLPRAMTPYPFLMQRLFERERGDEPPVRQRRPVRAR